MQVSTPRTDVQEVSTKIDTTNYHLLRSPDHVQQLDDIAAELGCASHSDAYRQVIFLYWQDIQTRKPPTIAAPPAVVLPVEQLPDVIETEAPAEEFGTELLQVEQLSPVIALEECEARSIEEAAMLLDVIEDAPRLDPWLPLIVRAMHLVDSLSLKLLARRTAQDRLAEMCEGAASYAAMVSGLIYLARLYLRAKLLRL